MIVSFPAEYMTFIEHLREAIADEKNWGNIRKRHERGSQWDAAEIEPLTGKTGRQNR